MTGPAPSQPSMVSDDPDQFETEVFPAELADIARRRKAAKVPVNSALAAVGEGQDESAEPSRSAATRAALVSWMIESLGRWFVLPPVARRRREAVKPSAQYELVGLALSGGGIRSAAFNLGVLQALAQRGILCWVDYLSTVSGGGYIGACLTSVLNDPNQRTDPARFPFRHVPGEEESDAFKHLRNYANYLTLGGLVDTIRIPALLLRGALVNLLTILPYVILLVLLTYGCYGRILPSAQFPAAWATFTIITRCALAVLIVWTLAYPFLYLLFRGSWGRRNWYERSFAWLVVAVAVAVLWEAQPIAIYFYYYYAPWLLGLDPEDLFKIGNFKAWLPAIGAFLSFVGAGAASQRVANLRGKLALYALGLLGPLILWYIYLHLATWLIFREQMPYTLGVGSPEQTLWVAVLVLLAYGAMVDVNVTSLHNFYRDRLSRTFLFRLGASGTPEPADRLKLSALHPPGSSAPYHLINATLNLQHTDDIALRGRRSDFFIFSKRFVGGPRIGFCPTEKMEWADSHLDLGTAMAISGAAAAPNMGTTTIKPLVFIMALLNVRLGYWLPNPRRLRSESLPAAFVQALPVARVGPVYLLREFFSLVDETSANVNVSDGGHLENLGVYELLRRRCKFIIACDAEEDPEPRFGGLAKLMRYARVNQGIDIEIDLADLRKTADPAKRRHYALGTIRYGGGETGWLFYIKASVTDDENEYIREYRSRHPEFPHESTTDQFFDEAQFEAYRALGYHVVP